MRWTGQLAFSLDPFGKREPFPSMRGKKNCFVVWDIKNCLNFFFLLLLLSPYQTDQRRQIGREEENGESD